MILSLRRWRCRRWQIGWPYGIKGADVGNGVFHGPSMILSLRRWWRCQCWRKGRPYGINWADVGRPWLGIADFVGLAGKVGKVNDAVRSRWAHCTGIFVVFKTKHESKCQNELFLKYHFSGNQCLCFHYWDYLTNFWRNNWRSIIDVVERLG